MPFIGNAVSTVSNTFSIGNGGENSSLNSVNSIPIINKNLNKSSNPNPQVPIANIINPPYQTNSVSKPNFSSESSLGSNNAVNYDFKVSNAESKPRRRRSIYHLLEDQIEEIQREQEAQKQTELEHQERCNDVNYQARKREFYVDIATLNECAPPGTYRTKKYISDPEPPIRVTVKQNKNDNECAHVNIGNLPYNIENFKRCAPPGAREYFPSKGQYVGKTDDHDILYSHTPIKARSLKTKGIKCVVL